MLLNIIHLQKRTDRFAVLAKEIATQAIREYKIWNGILDEANPKRGISKAHKQIVQWALIEGLETVTIAEDDVKFTAPGAYNYFLSQQPADFDIYLGGITYGKITSDGSVEDFAGTHLYQIKRKFFDKFLSLPEEKDIDRSLANKGAFKVCNPFVAIQHDGYSDNHKKVQSYNSIFRERKLFGHV